MSAAILPGASTGHAAGCLSARQTLIDAAAPQGRFPAPERASAAMYEAMAKALGLPIRRWPAGNLSPVCEHWRGLAAHGLSAAREAWRQGGRDMALVLACAAALQARFYAGCEPGQLPKDRGESAGDHQAVFLPMATALLSAARIQRGPSGADGPRLLEGGEGAP